MMSPYQVAARSAGELLDLLFADTLDRLSEALNLNPFLFQYMWTGMFVCGVALFLIPTREDNIVSMADEGGRFPLLRNTAISLCIGPFFLLWGFILLPPWLAFKVLAEIYEVFRGPEEK